MIAECVASLLRRGVIERAEAKLFADVHDEILQSLEASMGAAQAKAAAADLTMEAFEREVVRRKRLAGLTYAARKRMADELQENAKGGVDLAVAVPGLLSRDGRVRVKSTLEGRYDAIRATAQGMMADLLEAFPRNVKSGIRNAARMPNVVRELFGEATGDRAARELAGGWRETAEYLRQRFNAAGGEIGRIENWGLPQRHDMEKVRRAGGFDQWFADLLPRLDLARMLDERTRRPFTMERLREALQGVHQSIITDGWDGRPLGAAGSGMLANRRNEHRFLIFRSADDWLAYQRQYGALDPKGDMAGVLDLMTGHMSAMARDIAALEILGPNPASSIKWLGDLLRKSVGLGEAKKGLILNEASHAAVGRGLLENMWDIYSGTGNAVAQNMQAANIVSSVRNVMTSARLGSATLSAPSDIGFQQMTRAFNGLPAAKALTDMVRYLLPGRQAEKRMALRAGLMADEAISRVGALWRYQEELNTKGLTARLSTGVLKLSGLSRWTQMGKWSFGNEFMGALADHAHVPMAELPESFGNALRRYGIDAKDWELIRQVPAHDLGGARFLRPDEVRAFGGLDPMVRERLADRMLEMILTETRYAVPEQNLRVRSFMTLGTKPGTIIGELVRSGAQFKGFGLSVSWMHMNRAMYEAKSFTGGRMAYAASLIVLAMLYGGLSVQAKLLSKGQDPMPMDNGKFWTAAFMQGGGAGIYGDFLFSDHSRYGSSMASALLGPSFDAVVEQGLRLSVGSAQRKWEGDDTNFGREFTRVLKANTPGSSLWYARKAFDAAIWDTLSRMVDPEHDARNQRLARRAAEDFHAPYWWAPGDWLPERAPDLSHAIGDDR